MYVAPSPAAHGAAIGSAGWASHTVLMATSARRAGRDRPRGCVCCNRAAGRPTPSHSTARLCLLRPGRRSAYAAHGSLRAERRALPTHFCTRRSVAEKPRRRSSGLQNGHGARRATARGERPAAARLRRARAGGTTISGGERGENAPAEPCPHAPHVCTRSRSPPAVRPPSPRRATARANGSAAARPSTTQAGGTTPHLRLAPAKAAHIRWPSGWPMGRSHTARRRKVRQAMPMREHVARTAVRLVSAAQRTRACSPCHRWQPAKR